MPTQGNQRLRNATNQRQGAAFEAAFAWEATRNDLLAVRNGQAVRYLPGGRILAVRSNLDWTLVGREGLICFVDTKSFAGRHFTFSQLESHQLARACRYMERGFLAGFCVHFRQTDVVAFFSGRQVQDAGPRSAFGPARGRVLGHLRAFDLRRLWG